MKFHLTTAEGATIVSNLEKPCQTCLQKCNTPGAITNECGLYHTLRRNGILSGPRGKTFYCDSDTKTTKLFRDKIDCFHHALPQLQEFRSTCTKQAALQEHQKYKRILHNLKSLNAHTIQELYYLVPQEYISSNIKEQIDAIKDAIADDLDQSARTFIRIAKHHSHMKAEFTIQDKLAGNEPILQISPHVIRKVLMNVLHTFFIDFEEQDVQVTVNTNYTSVNVDYESIHVAFYHLILNASKYIRPSSTFKIFFSENDRILTVEFLMESMYIRPDEVSMIFEEGYSGVNPKKAKLSGEGIGMGRIKSLIALNKADFSVIPGRKPNYTDRSGIEYSSNVFRIDFKKGKI